MPDICVTSYCEFSAKTGLWMYLKEYYVWVKVSAVAMCQSGHMAACACM